jgi:hypothetical protein
MNRSNPKKKLIVMPNECEASQTPTALRFFPLFHRGQNDKHHDKQETMNTTQTLIDAAKELLHLHSCEQEGLQSGKPTPKQWFDAVNNLSDAIYSPTQSNEGKGLRWVSDIKKTDDVWENSIVDGFIRHYTFNMSEGVPDDKLPQIKRAIEFVVNETEGEEGKGEPEVQSHDLAAVASHSSAVGNSIEKDEVRKLILDEYQKGNVVFLSYDGLKTMPLQEFVKQPEDGILYDLNRNEVVVLTFLKDGDPKWINDFAVAKVIKELKRQLSDALLNSEPNAQVSDTTEAK